MSAGASVGKFCSETHQDASKGETQLGCGNGDVSHRTKGCEMVESTILKDVKEDASNENHASNDGEIIQPTKLRINLSIKLKLSSIIYSFH
jgi:hypothetical protein